MMIDPDWLAQIIELTLGRACDAPAAQALAAVLADQAEVLPWLVLRQQGCGPGEDPAIMGALHAQACQIAQAQSGRAPGFAVSAPLVGIDRALCDGLRLLVAEDVARAELADEVHGLFVRRHAVAARGLDHAYRFHIGDPVER